ncbi:MAG: cupin domain-containing protein [Bacteroidota bacterium]
MNLKPYIESGILELYALNSLANDERRGVERMLATYPELKHELDAIEFALENYAKATSVKPPDYLKERIVESLFPLINRFADYKNWLPLIKGFDEVSLAEDGRYLKILRHDERVTQILIVSTTDIEEETHEDEYESFLILEGECRCTIGDKLTLMAPGDYMEIPLHEPHDVELVSERVIAILQRVKV